MNESHASLQLVEPFLTETNEEDAPLAASLARLDERGRGQLAGVLGRFGAAARHELHATDRLRARRLLKPLRHHDTEALELLNKILDYLDLDANGRLDEQELDLCASALESFARMSPPDHVMNRPELEALSQVLRALDANDDHRLDVNERKTFFEGMTDPAGLVARLGLEPLPG